MIYTPGIAVSQMSGSVGGTTASRNRGGQYFRNRAIPSNPSSTAQQNIRNILATVSQAWGDLTDAQRASWEAWADEHPIINALGQSVLMSGHQAYNRINSRLSLDSQTNLSVPPVANAPLGLTSLTLDADIGAGDFDLTFAATPLAAGIKLWIEGCVVTSPGISYVRNLYRFVATSAAAQASPLDIEAAFTTKFGTPQVGQTVFIRCRTFDTATGLVSVPRESSKVVTST